MENLGEWLLALYDSSLPTGTSNLHNPVCEDDIAGFFATIVKQPGSDLELDLDLVANFLKLLGTRPTSELGTLSN